MQHAGWRVTCVPVLSGRVGRGRIAEACVVRVAGVRQRFTTLRWPPVSLLSKGSVSDPGNKVTR